MSKSPKNVVAWKEIKCYYCKKKLKDAKKPFIKGPDTGSRIYCEECVDILFCHYDPPKGNFIHKPKKSFNPSRR